MKRKVQHYRQRLNRGQGRSAKNRTNQVQWYERKKCKNKGVILRLCRPEKCNRGNEQQIGDQWIGRGRPSGTGIGPDQGSENGDSSHGRVGAWAIGCAVRATEACDRRAFGLRHKCITCQKRQPCFLWRNIRRRRSEWPGEHSQRCPKTSCGRFAVRPLGSLQLCAHRAVVWRHQVLPFNATFRPQIHRSPAR